MKDMFIQIKVQQLKFGPSSVQLTKHIGLTNTSLLQ